MVEVRTIVSILALGVSTPALAHPAGGPAVAWPSLPHRPGEVADRAYRFTWIDPNFFTPTGTISIDWFYTSVMPPTFQLGATPMDLQGTPIVLGIDEEDRTDAYVWDTSTVAPGAYWIWSRVHDLPGEVSLRINAFSRGVVVVAHPGDELTPAIAMITPRTPFELIDAPAYDVVFEAFDPAGDGRVTIEAMRSRTGEDAIVVAEDLPATASATISWRVAEVEPGEWILRARSIDGRGRRAVAYARFYLTILPRPTDGGVSADAAPARDIGSLGDYDSGVRTVPSDPGCSTTGPSGGVFVPIVALWIAARRRRLLFVLV